MVSSAYMLDKPKTKAPTAVFVDQRIVPALIDAAAAIEGLIERVGVRTRAAPSGPLAAAFCAGALLAAVSRSRR